MNEALEVIELGANTRLVLTDDHRIYLEGGARHSGTARVAVSDVDELRKALRDIATIKAEHVARADREARAWEPIDDATRKAVFAALRDVYGRELSDDERLATVSALAGREIWSMGRNGNMTMADAHRVLDVLGTLPVRAS